MRWSRAFYAVLILVVLVFLYIFFIVGSDSADVVELSEVISLISDGQVETIRQDQNELRLELANGTERRSYIEEGESVTETLPLLGISKDQMATINISIAPRSAWDGLWGILGALLPLILIGGFFFFILRQAQGAGKSSLEFWKKSGPHVYRRQTNGYF